MLTKTLRSLREIFAILELILENPGKITPKVLLKAIIVSLISAFSFLTILPIHTKRVSERQLAGSVAFFPLTGFLIGLFLYGVCWGGRRLAGDAAASVLTVTAWLIATRGLHFDGLVDTVDGFFGGSTPEERMRIMKDGRVGAFGVAGGALLLIGKIVFLLKIGDGQLFGVLLVVPSLARLMVLAMCVLSRRPAGEGLGAIFVKYTKLRTLIPAAVFFLVPSFYLVPAAELLIVTTLALSIAGLLVLASHKKIGGVNGDVFGACVEITEWMSLFAFSAL